MNDGFLTDRSVGRDTKRGMWHPILLRLLEIWYFNIRISGGSNYRKNDIFLLRSAVVAPRTICCTIYANLFENESILSCNHIEKLFKYVEPGAQFSKLGRSNFGSSCHRHGLSWVRYFHTL